jgi:hypothetical protein
MSEACQHLHDVLSRLPHFKREDLAQVPKNGIYVLFEKGEEAHGGGRIVRVGTHRGQNSLPGRIREHLYKPNKDRSIFRKHIGRCLLAKTNDPFLAQWELDLTPKDARALNGDKVDKDRVLQVEAEVTSFMIENSSFAVLLFETQAEHLHYEECLLSTIYQCPDCGPSETWLGRHHPHSAVIRTGGLWNVQGLSGPPLSLEEAPRVLRSGMVA